MLYFVIFRQNPFLLRLSLQDLAQDLAEEVLARGLARFEVHFTPPRHQVFHAKDVERPAQ